MMTCKISPLAIALLLSCLPSALAQTVREQLTTAPTSIKSMGGPAVAKLSTRDGTDVQLDRLQGATTEIPLAPILKLSSEKSAEAAGSSRSARDAEIYRATSPSVVRVLTNGGAGSGSLIGTSGEILTNYHVVKGQSEVALVFKPAIEGAVPTRDDIKLGHVIKYDEIADLALVRAAEIPKGKTPIRLGDPSEIAIGVDVSAIGHPDGQAWTFTKGVISQYRIGFEWLEHKADVIQTQTPINPGNSGGPLISESGNLIGVNSFKREDAEGLNFSVSVDEVRKFLARKGNRLTQANVAAATTNGCALKELSRFRNEKNDATIISYDTKCAGRADANYIIPDSKADAIMYTIDRNGDGRPDVIFFDLKRQKRWDISFWDEDFEGRWTLVGYHPDGKLTPSSFESYEKFQSRLAAR